MEAHVELQLLVMTAGIMAGIAAGIGNGIRTAGSIVETNEDE
jgi:hypothetical protein